MNKPILLVEDTPSLAMVYETVLKKKGYEIDSVGTVADARDAFQKNQHQIVLLDLLLPDGNGSELMEEFIAQQPDVKIIVITAHGSINRAVEAMRMGSFDFLVKPFDELRLTNAVENAVTALNQGPIVDPDTPMKDGKRFHGFIGGSDKMQDIYRMVRNIGRSTATVFVTGESGTGKELCAEAIHKESSRAEGPFIPLNCGAIPADLLESEVFGHLQGSFPGAIADKEGAAAAADGGTLFLDEICEMDLSLQTKLLRFLQTSTIQPVGATKPRVVDVRIVCSTNRNPIEEVRAGRFREDLFYRLHVVPIHLPPLSERPKDIMEIADIMLAEYSAEEGKSFKGFSDDVERIFTAHSWPGNVRQLMNVIRNIVVLHNGTMVNADMLPADITPSAQNGGSETTSGQNTSAGGGYGPINISAFVGTSLAQLEREFIEATIEFCDGSIPQAARLLDVSPSTLYRKKESWENS